MSGILTVIGLAIATLIAIGAALALVRGSYNKARVQALREDNDDLRKRIDDLDRTVARHEGNEKALNLRIDAAENENMLLREMVLQRAKVEDIGTMLDAHHQQSMAAWAGMTTAIKELAS